MEQSDNEIARPKSLNILWEFGFFFCSTFALSSIFNAIRELYRIFVLSRELQPAFIYIIAPVMAVFFSLIPLFLLYLFSKGRIWAGWVFTCLLWLLILLLFINFCHSYDRHKLFLAIFFLVFLSLIASLVTRVLMNKDVIRYCKVKTGKVDPALEGQTRMDTEINS
jgi:hypothetical protein